MYLQNKYTHWYNNIISNAKIRTLPTSVYVEKHHIVPRSLGGNNSLDNLVKLTAKEHYICHLLLTKMTIGKQKRSMCHAAWKIINQGRSYQDRYKVSSRMYESIKQQNAIALSVANTGKPNLALQGRIIDNEHRNKIRQTLLAGNYKGIKKPKKQCDVCHGWFAGHIITRFHNNNCKSLLSIPIPTQRVAWNKGLTKNTDERVAKLAIRISQTMSGAKRGQYNKHL